MNTELRQFLTLSCHKRVDRRLKAKLYNLTYRGDILLYNARYAVCNKRQHDLLKTGNYQHRHFEIVKTQDL